MTDLRIKRAPRTLDIKIDKPDVIVHLKARKTIAGDVMIYDHPDIDIVVSPKENKVFALSKKDYGDNVYATQSRLFHFLTQRGIIDGAKIRSGNIFGSLEGPILVAEEAQKEQVDPLQIAIYSVAKFLQEEAPHTRGYKEYEAEFDKELTDPAEDETTELGKVPHEPRKGTNHTYPGSTAAYGLVGYHYEE
tara:strand:+ start:1251 stop:1823 length:573 start_codon:yes stop_codon:yes gene_type:complete